MGGEQHEAVQAWTGDSANSIANGMENKKGGICLLF